jgi:lipoprotein NlpD
VKRLGAAAALATALLAACASSYQAPVVERPVMRPGAAKPAPSAATPATALPGEKRAESYTVRRGDTLYSIALDHGVDYRELAAWNAIADPSLLKMGQVLRMQPPEQAAVQTRPETDVRVQPAATPGSVETHPLGGEAPRPVPAEPPRALSAEMPRSGSEPLKTSPKAMKLPYSEQNLALLLRAQPSSAPPKSDAPAPPSQKPEDGGEPDAIAWMWPASGRVLAGFSEATNKGVDIFGKVGDPVFASAGGRVVYSGVGLRGYGKLVIIKHNQTYLSAYAHNSNILVKEGQNVARGQKIAEIGNSDSPQTKLHFEIRRLGKPVDPLKFLPERPS